VNRLASAALVFGAAALLAGCSTTDDFKGVEIGETPTLITSVPPLLQTKRVSCGPTSVAAVAAYWGKDYSLLTSNAPPLLAEDFNVTDLTNLVGMLELKSFVYSGSTDDLESHLRNGRPMIVLIPTPEYRHGPEVRFNGVPVAALRGMMAPKYSHWVICIGFTDSKMILQDPARGRMAVSRTRFESWWNSKKRTCLLIVP
jgi:predicted double-glycine peptidase